MQTAKMQSTWSLNHVKKAKRINHTHVHRYQKKKEVTTESDATFCRRYDVAVSTDIESIEVSLVSNEFLNLLFK